VRGIYGLKWVEAAGPLSILALAWPAWLMGNLSGNVLTAKNWMGREFAVQVASLVITCLAVVIGIPYGIEGVAWAIVGTAILTAAYQYWLAIRCLGAKLSGFPRAVAPAMVLNSLLAGTLFLTDHLLPLPFHNNDITYLSLMVLAGSSVYIMSFLYLPIAMLKTEQQRWKNALRLAGKKTP